MEDLPNGFLNFPTNKSSDFESAGDAIRRHSTDVEYNKVRPDNLEAQKKALRDGWRVVDAPEPESKGVDVRSIVIDGEVPLQIGADTVTFSSGAPALQRESNERANSVRFYDLGNERHAAEQPASEDRYVPSRHAESNPHFNPENRTASMKFAKPNGLVGVDRHSYQERHGGPDLSRRYRKDDLRSYVRVPSSADGEVGPVFDYGELDMISELDRRWSWIEINLDALKGNIRAIRETLDPETMFMAVVKADGYGHGAVPCAKAAINAGADYIGVATIDEAMEIRQAGIDAPLLILSEPPLTSIPLLLGYNIMPSVATVDFALKYAEAADSIGATAPYHLKINTGMNRVGVRYDAILDFLQTISFHRALRLVGTFTHFATADEPDTMEFNLQKRRFEEALATMRAAGFDPGIVHAANSAAALRYKDVQYDMVRLGLAMYGYYPSPETFGAVNLMPAMSIKARITQINQVPVGEGVSYGLLHRSNGFGKICTVPIGYADGLNRDLSGRIDFIKDGKLYPQVGNICMDQCMFEMDERTRYGIGKLEPHIGDEVIIVGEEGDAFVTIDRMAEMLGTIPYEVMISFGNSRMPKIYV